MNKELENIIEACTDKQDRISPGWSERAMNKLRAFVIFNEEFITEEFRSWATSTGLEEPQNNKAYGHIMRTAESLGIIRKTDRYKPTGAKSHHRPMRVWVGIIR